MRQLLLVAALVVALILGAGHLLNQGEVVTIQTQASDGSFRSTPVWIVQIHGTPYLRAGSPSARWLDRLRARPEVLVERGGVERRYLAHPREDPRYRRAVNRAMAEKYGLADQLVTLFIDRNDSVPIRLEEAG